VFENEVRLVGDASRSPAEIEPSPDLGAFFRRLVWSAADRRGFEATHAARSYLVGLLADFAKPEASSAVAFSRPVTLLLEEALRAQAQHRFERLRVLGDGVLYTTGFFRRHLESRGVAPAYVAALGARAYDHAATLLSNPRSGGAPDVLRELAENFDMFRLLLNEVADELRAQSAPATERATLELYESWLRSQSAPLMRALVERGLVPVARTETLH
jgi:hypothetical protein